MTENAIYMINNCFQIDCRERHIEFNIIILKIVMVLGVRIIDEELIYLL